MFFVNNLISTHRSLACETAREVRSTRSSNLGVGLKSCFQHFRLGAVSEGDVVSDLRGNFFKIAVGSWNTRKPF